jgi:hypothetical protein
MKKNEMGRACGRHGRQEMRVQSLGGEDPMERDHLEDFVVDGRIILK